MNIEEFSDIVLDINDPNTKGMIVLKVIQDGTFFVKEFGELGYLEKVGILATCQHDYMQEAYDDCNDIEMELEDDNG